MKNKVGVIAGNFDVLHPGYISMFSECKNFCDTLVVLLHTDPSIERPEKLKPILSVEERRIILRSLRQVDVVATYSFESELLELLKKLNPDVRFLGSDYVDKPFTGSELEIPIKFLDRSHGWSATKYKTLIAEQIHFKND